MSRARTMGMWMGRTTSRRLPTIAVFFGLALADTGAAAGQVVVERTDTRVAAIDADGTERWSTVIEDLTGTFAQPLPDGGVRLVGSTHQGPPRFETHDLRMIELGPDGEIRTSETLGIVRRRQGPQQMQAVAGGYLVLGRMAIGESGPDGVPDWRLTMWNMAGTPTWGRTFEDMAEVTALPMNGGGYMVLAVPGAGPPCGGEAPWCRAEADLWAIGLDAAGRTQTVEAHEIGDNPTVHQAMTLVWPDGTALGEHVVAAMGSAQPAGGGPDFGWVLTVNAEGEWHGDWTFSTTERYTRVTAAALRQEDLLVAVAEAIPDNRGAVWTSQLVTIGADGSRAVGRPIPRLTVEALAETADGGLIAAGRRDGPVCPNLITTIMDPIEDGSTATDCVAGVPQDLSLHPRPDGSVLLISRQVHFGEQ